MPRRAIANQNRDTFRARLLGCELRRLRVNRGLTLTSLARQAGISASFLSEIEQGKKSPSLASLDAISAALAVTREALVPPQDARLDAPGLPTRVRRARERLSLTQENLAARAEVSSGLIAQIESGATQPSLATVEGLSLALEVTPCYLLVDDPDPERLLASLRPRVRRMLADPDAQLLLETAAELDRRSFNVLLEMARTLRRM